MFDLDVLHGLLRISHIAIGFAGLALFWMPVIARKGSRMHIASGRLFAWCAYFVGASGLLASVWGLVHPASFIGEAEFRALDQQQARLAAENLRFILSITGFFGLGVLSGVVLGAGIMRAGERHEQLRRTAPLLLSGGFTLWSAGLLVYGAGSLAAAHAGWHFVAATAANQYWISVALGAFGVYGGSGDLKYICARASTPAERMAMHIECMIGAGAAFYAAFLLFGATRLFALPGYWLLAPVLPVAIGAVATKLLVARHQRRFLMEPNTTDQPAGVESLHHAQEKPAGHVTRGL